MRKEKGRREKERVGRKKKKKERRESEKGSRQRRCPTHQFLDAILSIHLENGPAPGPP